MCPVSAMILVSFCLLPNCLVIVPKEPTTNGIIFTLTFQTFCNSPPRSWYFSIFSFSFYSILISPGTAKLMILQVLLLLTSTTKSGLRASITWSVWILISPKILWSSFSKTLSDSCSYHLSPASKLHFLASFFFCTPSAQVCYNWPS